VEAVVSRGWSVLFALRRAYGKSTIAGYKTSTYREGRDRENNEDKYYYSDDQHNHLLFASAMAEVADERIATVAKTATAFTQNGRHFSSLLPPFWIFVLNIITNRLESCLQWFKD
jgi:hypothetical protein